MKVSSLRWQTPLLTALMLGTLAMLGWSLFFHGDATADRFMPHEHCYLLKPGLILLHGLSDLLIGISYVAISATLTYLVLRARQEIPFHWMMLAFATFIVACGATHFMEVFTLRTPDPPYWMAGDLKLVTAFASLATALVLPPLVPKILQLLGEARLSTDRAAALQKAHVELAAALERVQQLDQLKTNFFANISHELRTPVTLIVGPVDHLLAQPALDAEARGDLLMIRRNAVLLQKHVNDLLDVSRIEAGKMRVNYRSTDLAQLVRLVGSYFSSSSVRPLDLTIEGPETLPAELDPGKIERVLLNLVSNAYKFTPDGGVVKVTLTQELSEVEIVVEDNGPGVPPELRESIFERFNQGLTPTSRGGAGTGLGLSIVREFVELHLGTVRVRDGAGEGAAFVVRLPLRAPAGAEVLPAEEAPLGALQASALPRLMLPPFQTGEVLRATPQEPGGLPHVVLAEDNPDMSEHIRRTLAGEFRLTITRDGAAALAAAEAQAPDLILSDLMMPGMNGEALLLAVRAHPRLAGVPVILLTARADEEVRLHLLRSGAQDFLLKPFAAEELRARVRNLVTTKQVRDTLQLALSTQEHDLARLAQELMQRARDLEQARDVAEAANHAKDRFLAVLSHELRTPLTPALALAIDLDQQVETDPQEVRRGLGIIRRNIELEARLIDDLLDITRVARGKLELQLSEVDAHRSIRDAVEMCQAEFERKGCILNVSLTAARSHVQADASRLLQIFWNLLLNAVKFTPSTGRVSVRSSNPAAGALLIEVADSGVGISPDAMPRIFEAFEQGERQITREFGGLGLGLAVVKGLVDAHGGTIRARSEGVGKGSAFELELAAVDAPDVPAASPAKAAHDSAPSHSLHILLVEDHEDTRHAMSKLLTRWGHTVEAAGTVREALAQADAAHFNLLVSDLGLPDAHGAELMEELRRRGHGMPGIAVSGFGMEADVQRSRAAGFQQHLTKPVAAQQLKALLEELARHAED